MHLLVDLDDRVFVPDRKGGLHQEARQWPVVLLDDPFHFFQYAVESRLDVKHGTGSFGRFELADVGQEPHFGDVPAVGRDGDFHNSNLCDDPLPNVLGVGGRNGFPEFVPGHPVYAHADGPGIEDVLAEFHPFAAGCF